MHATVIEIAADATHALRRQILRVGTPSDVVVFEGDEEPTTFHLGAVDIDGTLIGVSTWVSKAYPDRPALVAYQLRGMATAVDAVGQGVGSALLTAGLDRCRAGGAQLVWARGRDSALGFYLRHGFNAVGLGYVDLTTALPHHDIVCEL